MKSAFRFRLFQMTFALICFSQAALAHDISINPVNALFGKQVQMYYLFPIKDDIAAGPLIGYQHFNKSDVDNNSVQAWEYGVRIEKAPKGFDADGYYSSIGVGLQNTQYQSNSMNCEGEYIGYGGTFLAGYALRENKNNITTKIGAGLHSSINMNTTIDCADGSVLVLTGVTDSVDLDLILELSIGYSF